MFKPPASSQRRSEAASIVKAWTRRRFSLNEEATVFVTELQGGMPGFPPLRTVVSFWIAERGHYHFTVFKPLEEAGEDDIPPSWYLEALKVEAGAQCGCC